MHRIIYLLLLGIAGCTSGEHCSQVYSLEEGNRYEPYLKAAKAFPLCPTDSAEKEKYRFVLLRGAHNPIVVTLVKDRVSVSLTAIRLDGLGESGPGETVETRGLLLSNEEYERFKSLIEAMDFWNLKTRRQLVGQRSLEAAGGEKSRWILEGANQHRAYAVDRGSDVHGLFREACMFLLEKSQIGTNGEIY
jgi:hypothetical protein